jgi:hypothetical protein
VITRLPPSLRAKKHEDKEPEQTDNHASCDQALSEAHTAVGRHTREDDVETAGTNRQNNEPRLESWTAHAC